MIERWVHRSLRQPSSIAESACSEPRSDACRNCRTGRPLSGVNIRGSLKAWRAASFLRILLRGKRMKNLAMSWNSKDGHPACRWRELERIESDAILHDLEPDDPQLQITDATRR